VAATAAGQQQRRLGGDGGQQLSSHPQLPLQRLVLLALGSL